MVELTEKTQKVFTSEIIYRNSFVDKKGFENKRFSKYVGKVKDYIFNEYLKVVYFKIFERENHCSNLTDFIIQFFQNYYLADMNEKGKEIKGSLFSAFHEYTVPTIDIFINQEFLEMYLTNPYQRGRHFLSLELVVNNEIKSVCKDYIKLRSLELNDINASNYFLTLPKNTKDAIFIFDTIINHVKINIEHLCCSYLSKDIRSMLNNHVIMGLQKNNEELSKSNKRINDELTKNSQQIKELNERLIESSCHLDNEKEELSEQNHVLQRQISKIKRKYDSLFNKYKTLKNETTEEDEILEQEESFGELNLNGKYLFVSSENSTFKQLVISEFPNSTFCSSNININDTIDLVIILVEHIDHSTYYGIKEQCKNKKIPLVHCRFSNIDLIKELMWNSLNL